MHRIVNRQAGSNYAARRIDVEVNVFFRIFGFQEKQLRDDQVGNLIVNRRAEKNNIVFEKSRVDIKRALATRRLLDHHWNKGQI